MAFSHEHHHHQLSKPLTILQLLHKSLTLSITNLSHLLPSLLLSFLSSTSRLLIDALLLQPLITSVAAKATVITSLDPSSPDLLPSFLQDITKLAIIQLLDLLLSFSLTSLVSIFTIRALSKQHASSSSSSSSFLKGPMITQLYIWLFYQALNSVFLSLAFLLVRHHSMPMMTSVLVVASAFIVLDLGWYCCWSVVMSVAAVVSVEDQDRCGMRAIATAWGIVKRRRSQAVKLAVVELVYCAFKYAVAKSSSSSPLVVQVGASAVVMGMAEVFRWAAAAVYYRDYRRSTEGIIMEMVEVEEGGGFMYSYVRLPMEQAQA